VKGTTSRDAEQIIITRKEVQFAREHQPDMLLVVVSGIEVGRDERGNVSARAGTASLRWNWAPEESQLRATAYFCTLALAEPLG
jgi:hypothetical protein